MVMSYFKGSFYSKIENKFNQLDLNFKSCISSGCVLNENKIIILTGHKIGTKTISQLSNYRDDIFQIDVNKSDIYNLNFKINEKKQITEKQKNYIESNLNEYTIYFLIRNPIIRFIGSLRQFLLSDPEINSKISPFEFFSENYDIVNILDKFQEIGLDKMDEIQVQKLVNFLSYIFLIFSNDIIEDMHFSKYHLYLYNLFVNSNNRIKIIDLKNLDIFLLKNSNIILEEHYNKSKYNYSEKENLHLNYTIFDTILKNKILNSSNVSWKKEKLMLIFNYFELYLSSEISNFNALSKFKEDFDITFVEDE